MKINFVTSGFPNGFTDEFIGEVKKHLANYKNFVFIASDFTVHDKTSWYAELFLRLFAEKGVTFDNNVIVDFEITPEQAQKHISEADVVWLAGGPTLTQIEHIRQYNLISALRERDGITIGMSAGSINMAKRVVLAKDINDNVPELSIYDGIGLVDFNIEPHINEANEEHICDIKQAAKIAPIFALHDEAFIKEIDEEITFYGKYKLYDETENNI